MTQIIIIIACIASILIQMSTVMCFSRNVWLKYIYLKFVLLEKVSISTQNLILHGKRKKKNTYCGELNNKKIINE